MSFPRFYNARSGRIFRFAAILLCFSILSNGAFAQFASSESKRQLTTTTAKEGTPAGQSQIAPTPIQITYGYTVCKEIFDAADPRFPQVSNPAELIINAIPPYPAPASLITATNPNRQHLGYSLGDNPNLFVSFFGAGGTSFTGWSLSWTAPANVDRLVSVIAVRSNPSGLTNVYSYPNLSVGDTGTFTAPGGGVIDQVNICFEPFTGPSSAPVAISGRALTAEGTGIAGTRITVVDLGSGESHSAITNPFGYYTIEGLVAESTYMVSASHKRHSFVNNQRTITISEDLAGVDFVAP